MTEKIGGWTLEAKAGGKVHAKSAELPKATISIPKVIKAMGFSAPRKRPKLEQGAQASSTHDATAGQAGDNDGEGAEEGAMAEEDPPSASDVE